MSSTHTKRALRTPSQIWHDGWFWGSLALAGIMALPVFALIWLSFGAVGDVWPHLMAHVIPTQLITTLQLMLGVGIICAVTGTITAWLVTFCQFPGRRFFAWALLLPLAMPTYLSAYSYADMLDQAGRFYGVWSALFAAEAYPRIHSIGGAIGVLSLVLYPYVFLSARAAFIQQSTTLIEAARTLGLAPAGCFWRVGLPLARPAVAVGVALVLMECLNDIGAVEHLGVETLTIGVYDTWLVRGSLVGAAQLALMLLGFISLLMLVERSQRRTGSYSARQGRQRSLLRFMPSKAGAIAAFISCLLPVLFGFILPTFALVSDALDQSVTFELQSAATNSFMLAAIAAALTTCLGLLLAYGARSSRIRAMRALVGFSALGYAIPGTVLAIGIMITLTGIDRSLGYLGSWSGGAVLSGSLVALVFAYTVRFLALAHGTLEAGFGRISPHMDMAARSLGTTRSQTLFRVHIFLLRPPVLAALLLVFVDVMKELPATLVLRPFDFDTLATLVYMRASLGQLEEAALPALMIILVGLVPVVIALMLLDTQRR
jgi:iron(III) transport system permease protein